MNTNAVLGYLLLSFLIIPFLPRQVLMLTDFLVVRIALLAVLVSVACVSPVAAVLALTSFAFIFIQRNKLKMHRLERAMQQSDEESPAIQSIMTPPTAPEQPDFDVPEVESHPYMPQKDSGDDSFTPVDYSINHKLPLETESADGSKYAIEQLFEWVNPDKPQE